MAASLRGAPVPETPDTQISETRAPSALAAPVHAYLSRLAALHDEAAETAHLANLLGRGRWVGDFLAVAAVATALVSAEYQSFASIAVWLLLMATAVFALGLIYARANKAPFERPVLKQFAKNFSATLLYAGAAWGSGLLLALPDGVNLQSSIAFAIAPAALLVVILRARDVALCFVAPATAMGAFCVLMRQGNAATAAGILAGGLIVAAASVLLERLMTSEPRTARS